LAQGLKHKQNSLQPLVPHTIFARFATMFGTCKTQCGPCRTADPVADKVTVDPALFASGKENSPPMMTLDKLAEERKLEEERQNAEAERKRIEAAEAERRRAEAEAAAKAEAERLEKERLHALEAAEQLRLEEQRRLEEHQLRLEEQRRCWEEQQAQEAVEREERAKDEAAKRKVQKFLKDNGFSGVNSKKTSLMSHKYALHTAVDKKDAETVGALLRCKADPSLQNSSKKTPEQLASSVNKKGSHDQVLTVLRAHA